MGPLLLVIHGDPLVVGRIFFGANVLDCGPSGVPSRQFFHVLSGFPCWSGNKKQDVIELYTSTVQ